MEVSFMSNATSLPSKDVPSMYQACTKHVPSMYQACTKHVPLHNSAGHTTSLANYQS